MDQDRSQTLWTSGLWAAFAAVAMVAWIAWGNLKEDTDPARAPYGALVGVRSDQEAAALGALLEEAYGVLRSDELQRALRQLEGRYPAVYARPAEPAASVDEVARTVALDRPGARFAPAQVALADGGGPELGMAGEGPVTGRYSDMVISREVLALSAARDPVRRSCAINVAAHEYAHTISLTPMGYSVAFTDTGPGESRIRGRRDRSTPVASYLIGAVAQCVWLRRQGRIGAEGVPACVQVFGTAAFNWDRCGQFAQGQPVAPRPGLAPAAPPL